MTDVAAVPGLEKLSDAELTALGEAATRGRVPVDCLAAVISSESGWDPRARNPSGGATGLIQFMPQTARDLGTSTDALAEMSVAEQLPFVAKFYARSKRKLTRCGDVYMFTFLPAHAHREDAFVLARRGDAEHVVPGTNIRQSVLYEQNRGLDANGDGVLTVGDVRAKVEGLLVGARGKPRVEIPEPKILGFEKKEVVAGALLGAVLWWSTRTRKRAS